MNFCKKLNEGLRLRHPGRMRSHLHVSQEVAQAPARPSRQAQGRASGVIGTLAWKIQNEYVNISESNLYYKYDELYPFRMVADGSPLVHHWFETKALSMTKVYAYIFWKYRSTGFCSLRDCLSTPSMRVRTKFGTTPPSIPLKELCSWAVYKRKATWEYIGIGRWRRWQIKRKLIIFAYLKSPGDRLWTHSMKHYQFSPLPPAN